MRVFSSYSQKTNGLVLRILVSESHLEFPNASFDKRKRMFSKGLFVLQEVSIYDTPSTYAQANEAT
jgi:hypothetical protein